MYVFMFIVFFNLLVSQDIPWVQIYANTEGYQYVMDTNKNIEMVATGEGLSDDSPTQIHYRNPEGEQNQIPGNVLAVSI